MRIIKSLLFTLIAFSLQSSGSSLLEVGKLYKMHTLDDPSRILIYNNGANVNLVINDPTVCEKSLFYVRNGLNGNANSISFESYYWPGYYYRHSGFWLRCHVYNPSTGYKRDATFFELASSDPTAVKFFSENYPTYLISHDAFSAKMIYYSDLATTSDP